MSEFVTMYFDFMIPILFHGPAYYFVTAVIIAVLSEIAILAVARYKGYDDHPLLEIPMTVALLLSVVWGGIVLFAPFLLLLIVVMVLLRNTIEFFVDLLFKAVDKLKARNEAKKLGRVHESK